MPSQLWPYVSPGIPDDLFERLPGIPMSKREVRLLLISYLRLKSDSVVWDIGAGTGTIPCLLYTSPSPRDGLLSRMPSSA